MLGDSVIRGCKTPLVVDFTSSIALPSAELPSSFTPTPCAEIVDRYPKNIETIIIDFCKRLGKELEIPVKTNVEVINEKPKMSSMENSNQKVKNGIDKWAVGIKSGDRYTMQDDQIPLISDKSKAVLLVDDFIDSRWSITIVGGLLSKQGFLVYPFCLGMKKAK